MSFWKNSSYLYQDITQISEDQLLLLTNAMTREDIQEWLMWNDPNGIYSDERSMKELGNIMTREEALEIMLRQADENRVL
ncbi:hypothetical protein [Mucilaginibacter sp. Mucisp84]|uniref:hypothetical protein n=1 Tax=Mucilaginibacter sp. Mucisp84 TaxID=3243058 RepID=UPI0039A653E3